MNNDPLNPTQGAGIVGKGAASADGPGPNVMAASTLDGNTVLSSDGEDIGKIKEIMLDVRRGTVAYAVIASGGFLGIGDKLLAVPWGALTLDTDAKVFRLNATAERVKAAPGFDKDAWPTMADRDWASSLHEHYGSEPYWRRSSVDVVPEEGALTREGESLQDPGGRLGG